MRKRRRLANKMTIMVCAVLIAVSAFFYAPMEVSAEEYVVDDINSSVSSTPINSSGYYGSSKAVSYTTPLNVDSFNESSLYKVTLSAKSQINLYTNSNATTRNTNSVSIRYNFLKFGNHLLTTIIATTATSGFNRSFTDLVFYATGSELLNENIYHYYMLTDTTSVTSLYHKGNLEITSCVIEELSVTDANQYQRGYEAGYADGVVAGEGSGYSSGYNDGYADGVDSVDTDSYYDSGYQAGESAGYDSGFQSGADSVDTQSYYDAGYQAGYDIAYQAGYDTGYEEAYDIAYESGYNSAMDRIASWGADTSDYPLKLSSGNTNAHFSVHVGSDIPFNYRDSDHWVSSAEYNSNHTYKYVINFSNIDEGLDSDILYDYWDIFLNIGGIEYNITPFQDMSVSVFIPGDRISTSYSFDWVLYNCANYVADDSNLAYLYVDYDFVIYDMGPSGDTQNHIANQTDQLTNGYDDSKGNTVNSNLSTGLNDYETAENSLFATATTGLKDFTFFDFESVPAMITGMSFIGSIMGSWFNQAGGASGVGIVLSILFSVILVAMVLGLYRWYQSRGGKN